MCNLGRPNLPTESQGIPYLYLNFSLRQGEQEQKQFKQVSVDFASVELIEVYVLKGPVSLDTEFQYRLND